LTTRRKKGEGTGEQKSNSPKKKSICKKKDGRNCGTAKVNQKVNPPRAQGGVTGKGAKEGGVGSKERGREKMEVQTKGEGENEGAGGGEVYWTARDVGKRVRRDGGK